MKMERNIKIQEAVEAACNGKRICFAAAGYDRGNSGVAYPAGYRRVIAINSTDAHGNPSAANPSPRDNDNNLIPTLLFFPLLVFSVVATVLGHVGNNRGTALVSTENKHHKRLDLW